MKTLQLKKSSLFATTMFGGMAACALGFAFAAPGTSGSTQDPGSSPYGASGQYDSSRDSGLFGTGTVTLPGMGGTGMDSSTLPPNVAPGWKIRVCSEKTKADQINFKFTEPGAKSSNGTGASGSSSGIGGTGSSDSTMGSANGEQTVSWMRGEATEINVPGGLRDAGKLHIEATPSQEDKQASICVIYDDHVAKKMKFDNREVSTVKNSDHGECGC